MLIKKLFLKKKQYHLKKYYFNNKKKSVQNKIQLKSTFMKWTHPTLWGRLGWIIFWKLSFYIYL
jgi:hypothetical protein